MWCNIRKLTISGVVAELLSYDISRNDLSCNNDYEEKEKIYEKEEDKIDYSYFSLYRSKTSLRRLVQSNIGQYYDKNGVIIPSRFLTLTFKENIYDVQSANRLFSKFILRYNYRFADRNGKIQYVCVPEFQKRGSVHFHMIVFNMPFMDDVYKNLREVWKMGRLKLDTLQNDLDMGVLVSYVVKYISKQGSDNRFFNKKRYFTSRNILRPIVIDNDVEVEDFVQKFNSRLFYTREFDNMYLGRMRIDFFDLSNVNGSVLNIL